MADSNSLFVENGETIWLAWVFENNPGLRYTSGTPGKAVSSQYWAGQMPSEFGSSSSSSYKYSICANYAAKYQQQEIELTGNPYMFTARAYDIETGLYYYRARYYNPYIGRFLQIDPAYEGMNLYAYCGNNPINCTDPSGQITSLPSTIGLMSSAAAAMFMAELGSSNYYYEHFQIRDDYGYYHTQNIPSFAAIADVCNWDFDKYEYSWTGRFCITNWELGTQPGYKSFLGEFHKYSDKIKLILTAADLISTAASTIAMSVTPYVWEAMYIFTKAVLSTAGVDYLNQTVDMTKKANSIIGKSEASSDRCRAWIQIRRDKIDRSILGNDTTKFWIEIKGGEKWFDASPGWYDTRTDAIKAISYVISCIEQED